MAEIKDLFKQDPGLEGPREPEGTSQPETERPDNVIPFRPQSSQPQRKRPLRPTSREGHLAVVIGGIAEGLVQHELDAAKTSAQPVQTSEEPVVTPEESDGTHDEDVPLPPIDASEAQAAPATSSLVSPADALTVITTSINHPPTDFIARKGIIE